MKRGVLYSTPLFSCIYCNRGGTDMKRNDCGGFLGICALALGIGILVAAIFPVGALMFLIAFLLIACGCCCLKR